MSRLPAVLIALTASLATTSAVEARPYLMLAADNQGFKALDLGDIKPQGVDSAQITLIDAPLAGILFGDKVAAMSKQRLEFECQGARWRSVSVSYADAKEAALGQETQTSDWHPIAGDPLLTPAKDAACLRRYNQTLVSRNLNLGDIVANYRKAWSPAEPEHLTAQQLAKQRFDAGH